MNRSQTAKRHISSAIAILMAVVMVATTPFITNSRSYADSDDSITATKGVYWFDAHEQGTDLTDTFVYDDALLTGDSLAYNQKLATMTFEFVVSTISSERDDYPNKSGRQWVC